MYIADAVTWISTYSWHLYVAEVGAVAPDLKHSSKRALSVGARGDHTDAKSFAEETGCDEVLPDHGGVCCFGHHLFHSYFVVESHVL